MFEQDRALVRLQQRVLADDAVLVCFLSGSYGRRQEDAYSDMDIALVYENDSSRERAWQNRRDFVQSVNPYVAVKSFDAAHIRPYFHIALFANGAKLDFRFETVSTLQPNPWDKDIRILKDHNSWAETFQAECQRLAFPRPHLTSQTLTELDNRFWVMFMDVFRLLLRGDTHKPFTIYLELLHFTLPPLLAVLPPEDTAYDPLFRASYGTNPADIRQHMVVLLDAYVAARTAVLRRLNLSFIPNSAFENEIQRLVKRKA
jgi:hypothetical protein